MSVKKGSLLIRFVIGFIVFTVVTVLMSGILTYVNQNRIYRQESGEQLLRVTRHLGDLIALDEENFRDYQQYFIAHKDELYIPIDFEDYRPAREAFFALFQETFPGKTYGDDIHFADLTEELKAAFTIWQHEYWLLTFETTRDDFGVLYTYYLVPGPDEYWAYYMIDAVREPRDSDTTALNLADYQPQDPTTHSAMWETWVSGGSPMRYDTIDNEYGRTYSYYVPLYIGGEEFGVIGVDVEIAMVNQEILKNSLLQIVSTTLILVVMAVIMLFILYRLYIMRIERLAENVRQYSEDKDPGVAYLIEKENKGRDEIAGLANQIAAMIAELEQYMKNLLETTQELSETKERAESMGLQATKDALTGVRNKTAYDNEIRQLEWRLADGFTEFGIALADLNDLNRINETYGREKGDICIKKLCTLICEIFQHSPVFRIGGDELAVILTGKDLKCYDALERRFYDELSHIEENKSLHSWEKVSAAIGAAFYDPAQDNTVSGVFKRADKAMYERKMKMKAGRE